LKEKEEALLRKQAEDKALRLKERQKLLAEVKAKKEKHNQDNAEQLEQLESFLLDEFQEGEEMDEEEEEEEMMEYCHPCQKAFRTKKAFLNHEKSKKHLAQLERWAAENNITASESEEEDLQPESEPESVPEEKIALTPEPEPVVKNGSSVAQPEKEDSDSDEETISARFVSRLSLKPETVSPPSKSKRKGKKAFLPEEAAEILPQPKNLPEELISPDESFDLPTKKGAKEKKRRRANKAKAEPVPTVPEAKVIEEAKVPEAIAKVLEEDSSDEHPKSKAFASKSASKSQQCGHCKEYFDSRSKLFKHIEKSGHALPPDAVHTLEEDRKSGKKSRAKRK
jgi:DnaJ family protein A protein 5